MHAPTEDHWSAVKRILHYLQATATYGLHITQDSPLSIHGFIDADWAASIDDRKSTDGHPVYIGSTPISWKSGKQRTVVRSFIVYCPTHIYRKGWLIIRLNLLIIS
jgi:hypothetical protein